MSDKPFSPSCERNREPILAVLREQFAERRRRAGDRQRHRPARGAFRRGDAVADAGSVRTSRTTCRGSGSGWTRRRLPNTPPPIELDVRDAWPAQASMRRPSMQCSPPTACTSWAGRKSRRCSPASTRCWRTTRRWWSTARSTTAATTPATATANSTAGCKARDPRSAIRDFEAVDALARAIGLRLVADVAMPANNRCLVWRRGRASRAE